MNIKIKKILFAITALLIAFSIRANAADPSWDQIKAAYKYDPNIPLNITVADTKDYPGFTKIHFYYDSLQGGRVPAILMLPKEHVKPMGAKRVTTPGTFPAVFFMHFHVSDKSLADLFSTWPGQGIAVMAIDGVFRGEREEKGKDIFMPDPAVSAANMKAQILDILRGFDVLASWKGVDPGRVGYIGISAGACTGTAAVALDNRIKTAIIADGAADFAIIFKESDYGDVADIKKYMDEHKISPAEMWKSFVFVDPLSFAPHLGDRPVLLMNGETDTTMTMPAMKKLHELVTSKNKKIIWYKSGHILPFDKVVFDSLKWFRNTL